jgi:hypothetical protein
MRHFMQSSGVSFFEKREENAGFFEAANPLAEPLKKEIYFTIKCKDNF